MRSKLLIALALVLLGSTAVMAQVALTNITDSSFVLPPKVVIDASQDSDKLFANATDYNLFFAPGESNDTLYIFTYTYSNESSNLLLIKRAIDASTLKAKGDDVKINLPIKSKRGVLVQPDIGYISFLYIRDDGEGTPDQLYLSILPLSADSNTQLTAKDVKLSNNTSTNISFSDLGGWLQNGYFIIPFLGGDKSNGTEKAIYLQGVNASDGSLLFPSAVKVVEFNNPPGTPLPIAGPNKSPNASSIHIVYKINDTGTIFQTSVSLRDGKVDEPTKLANDTDTKTYYPVAIIATNTTFGIVLDRLKETQNQTKDTLLVYFNGTTSKPHKLNVSLPTGYSAPVSQALNHRDGFILLTKFHLDQANSYVMQMFSNDGSVLIPQKTLAYTPSSALLQFFTDYSRALWLGYSDYDDSTDLITKAYLGKVLE